MGGANSPRPSGAAGAALSLRGPRVTAMLHSLTTSFISRLRANDQSAWFELWETFGPVLRAQLTKWGRGRIGPETVRDLSQETLAALSDCIDRYDPARGARFSTWLLAIAKHVLGDEMDRRSAQKRGGAGAQRPDPGDGHGSGLASRPVSLDETWMAASRSHSADAEYEAAVFRAKVHAALRLAEKECEFTDFEIFRQRVLEGRTGKDVARAMGVSEPTVSRKLSRVRTVVRSRLRQVITTYSFTRDELDEPERSGLRLEQGGPSNHAAQAGPAAEQGPEQAGPSEATTPADDAGFDEAIGDIYRLSQRDRVSEQLPTD